jgi:hypothetical protein
MPLRSDNKATKLRIIAERKRREMERLELQYQKSLDAYNEAWTEYAARCKELGYCAICEKQLIQCDCVLVG